MDNYISFITIHYRKFIGGYDLKKNQKRKEKKWAIGKYIHKYGNKLQNDIFCGGDFQAGGISNEYNLKNDCKC